MVKVWHAAFTIAKMTNHVKLTALDNSKLELRIVLARLVCNDRFPILRELWASHFASYFIVTFCRLFQENCKGGCPCESYECNELTTTIASTTSIATTTTAQPTNEAVLLLSTYKSSNVPMVIDFEGRTHTINVSSKF